MRRVFSANALKTPPRIRQEIAGELLGQLWNHLKGKRCKVYAAPFVVRPFERSGDRPEDVDTLVMPDISVVCDLSKLDDIGCRGAPDLVMEVLSPSTSRYDKFTKFNLYRRAGVREYWIVNPAGRYLQVFVLDDCTIDLSHVFAE